MIEYLLIQSTYVYVSFHFWIKKVANFMISTKIWHYFDNKFQLCLRILNCQRMQHTVKPYSSLWCGNPLNIQLLLSCPCMLSKIDHWPHWHQRPSYLMAII